jgi:CHAT domain-containing protein/tetratricopeptide (TPR) repeat protein
MWTFQFAGRLLGAALIGTFASMAGAANQATDTQRVNSRPVDSDDREAAQRSIAKATAAFLAGRVESATLIAQNGLKVAEDTLGPNDVATTQLANTLAQLLYRQGSIAKSEALFARVFEWNRRFLGDQHPETLASAQDLAFTYSDQAKFKKAEAQTRWILERSSKAFGPDDRMTLGFSMNLASIYKSEGRYADAENVLLDVVGQATDKFTDNDAFTVSANSNLAILYQQQGRFSEAESILYNVIELREKSLGPNAIETGLSLNNLAVLYSSEGRFNKAAPLFERVIAIADKAMGDNNKYSLTFFANLGMAYLNSGETGKAERILSEVVQRREAELGPDNAVTLSARSNLANVLDQAGRTAEAEALYRSVLNARQNLLGPDHPAALDSLHNLAFVAAKLGRREEAGRYYSTLVDRSIRALGLQHPVVIARLAAATRNRLHLASAAPRSVAGARLLVSAVRTRLALAPPTAAADAQRAREANAQSADLLLLPDAVWTAAAQKPGKKKMPNPEVFAALQDATAGTTSSAIARASARNIAASKSPALAQAVRLRQDLADQWAANESLFSSTVATASEDGRLLRETLATEKQRLATDIDRIDARLRIEFPGYFSLVRPEPLNIAATQRLLSNDEAILLAIPSEFGTHVVAVSRKGFKWVRSDWTQIEVETAGRRLLWDVGAEVGVDALQASRWEAEGGPGYPFDRKTAFALYRQLVAPVADVLAGKRHIFIASGGVLSSLPFGILVTEAPQGADGDPSALRATKWLADAYTLAVIPSVQSLQLLRRAREQSAGEATTSFAGYGDPSLEGQAESRGSRSRKTPSARSAFRSGITASGAATIDITSLNSLARLPGTAVELENIRAALGAPSSSVHVQREATEGAVKSADLTDVRMLALATHGLMAGELRGVAEPGLVFTPPQKASEQDDGLLTASEIAALKLNADWVILSACNTAAGDGSKGAQGLSGLARAFFFAGARNLLVSHWPVRDDVAARITVDTIRRKQSDPRLARAEALQQAMRAIRNDTSHDSANDTWAHPNAWAPFSLIGDGAR